MNNTGQNFGMSAGVERDFQTTDTVFIKPSQDSNLNKHDYISSTDSVDPVNYIRPKQHEPGAKLDQDKPEMELVINGFPRAVEAIGNLATFGKNKYSREGFLHVDNAINRYTSAMIRHMVAKAKGELIDPETGLTHASAVAWNAMAIVEIELRQAETELKTQLV
jgi:hypothetical protein